jgi:hypothetical protein
LNDLARDGGVSVAHRELKHLSESHVQLIQRTIEAKRCLLACSFEMKEVVAGGEGVFECRCDLPIEKLLE